MTDNELIEAVAIEIFGWHKEKSINGIECWFNSNHDFMYALRTGELWNPLTDMNHMMMVVERMRKCLFWFDIFDNYEEPGNLTDKAWYCNFIRKDPKIRGYSKHKSIGHAVCLAALEAVRQGKDA